jgi:hypothetical protein
MEGHELHPSQDVNGIYWFDPDEVERVIAEREVAGTSGSRGWLEAQQQARRVGCPTVCRRPPGERALLKAVGERLSVALIALTPYELSEIPARLFEAVTDVLEAVDIDQLGD